MIIFKSIEYANFMSTGNVPNKVDLNTHNTTIIVGLNGDGKSTIIEALTFALYKKPFRNISKGQLVNSINGKNALVTAEFDTAGSSYKVIRGIKPNIFEIWKDSVLITQDAALKDYQAVLEQQILGISYRAFTQVVILGAATFVPFMQLPAASRREVIEDILDIRIFSTMNTILKDKVQITKRNLEKTNRDIQTIKTTVDHQKRLIDVMITNKSEQVHIIEEKIEANKLEIVKIEEENQKILSSIDILNMTIIDEININETIDHANHMITAVNHANISLAKSMSFFDDYDSCPSCSQNIPHEHKGGIRDSLKVEYDLNLVEIQELAAELERCRQRASEIWKVKTQILTLRNESYAFISSIGNLNKQNESLYTDIAATKKEHGNIDLEKAKLKEYASEAMERVKAKTILQEQRNIEDIASILLKDTGIKTAVIKEYIPVINQLVNKYLNAMDFFVSFTLDDAFNESIKSRYRDNFSYASFSEGEKARINIALLLAWREISKMKNSVNTNLLILDEVMENSLDNAGTEYIMQLLTSLGADVNVVVISHNTDQLSDKFDKIIKVEKRNDFSLII